jgi:ATP-binding cassette, subfamily B, bacterial
VLSSPEQVTERVGARPAPWVRSEVRLSGVRFGYEPGRPVLDGIDLTVRAGETVCLLGPSGIGKSTILQLILRLFDVDAGAVCIDGVDVRDLQVRSLRERIAFVPQDPWLLDTTIAGNIAFGCAAPTQHAMVRAARLALVDEFVDRLPDGYDSQVGEGASQLSGGQRRRIALARAAMSQAPLVLLDEPTASLDPDSAAAVIEAITRSTSDRTVLIVTHDIGLARIADRVVTIGATSEAGLFNPSRPREEVSA